MNNPSNNEVREIKLNLLKQHTTCCGICLQQDDNSSKNLINWVQCSSCDIWFHVKCATGDGDEQDYTCDLCSTTDQASPH